MLKEFKLDIKEWPFLVPLVQHNLNHSPMASLGDRAPMELFTGNKPDNPLSTVLCSNGENIADEEMSIQKLNEIMTNLSERLKDMHKEVADKRETRTLLNQKHQLGEHLMNFDVGDFVLKSRVDAVSGAKLNVTWVGPYRVIAANSHNAFTVENLLDGSKAETNASRLKFYHDESLNVNQELIDHVGSQGMMLNVERFESHEWNAAIRDYKLLIKWQGLDAIESSWEPCKYIAIDVPVLLKKYAAMTNDAEFIEYVSQVC